MSEAVKKHIKKIGSHAVDFILPPLCPATGEMVDILGMVDPSFWQGLNFINEPFCNKCSAPFSFEVETANMTCGDCLETPPTYNQNRSALTYDDGSRNIILRFKHGDQTHAVKSFIPWLRQAGAELLDTADMIIPVPLHRNRLIKRRYNQADLIGRELVQYYPKIEYHPDALLRTKNTVPQGHKRAKDRKRNVFKAFETNTDYIYEGKNILIVDDVYTTGATLNECAKMLYRAGASEVNCLTLARVVRT